MTRDDGVRPDRGGNEIHLDERGVGQPDAGSAHADGDRTGSVENIRIAMGLDRDIAEIKDTIKAIFKELK